MKKFQQTFIWTALTVFLATGLFSCNDDAIYKKEMYKHVLALVSSENYNIFQEIVPLTDSVTDGYIAASCGGTIAPDKDITITLSEDTDPFDFYNWSLFDADEDQYAQLLPKSAYKIDNYQITIRKGERSGRTEVKIDPKGLSPDSTYFIALKIDSSGDYEMNDEKNTILYQVLLENKYASQADQTLYQMSGLIDSVVTAGTVKMLPLSKNRVRIMAGTVAFQANVDVINKNSIILEVEDNGHVNILPYKDITVTPLDNADYPNTFTQETDNFGRTFNIFSLAYEYTIGTKTRQMYERLTLEVQNDD
jgi:hypothetical protein